MDENYAVGGASIIYDINYNQKREAINKLDKIINSADKVGATVAIIFIILSVFITLNTIRLAIYTAREEISIMRLVGASNMFIRGPFMLQGVMYGFVAGVFSLLIFYPMLVWLGPRTEAFFEFNLFTYFVSNFSYIFGVLIGVGIVLGLVSSVLAVARYLRV